MSFTTGKVNPNPSSSVFVVADIKLCVKAWAGESDWLLNRMISIANEDLAVVHHSEHILQSSYHDDGNLCSLSGDIDFLEIVSV